ncbi:unnamed protein product, partial [Discosporangium mesarthrocarpum]
VVLKYAEGIDASFHRQLSLPLRLRVAQFSGGGLRLGSATDASECMVLVELANESPISLYAWRARPAPADGSRAEDADSDAPGVVEGASSVGLGREEGVVEIPGGSRRCFSARVPRLRPAADGREHTNRASEEIRSPLAPKPLRQWERDLLRHLSAFLHLRWSTSHPLNSSTAPAPGNGEWGRAD